MRRNIHLENGQQIELNVDTLPTIQLSELLSSKHMQSAQFLGEGSNAVVIKIGELAVKVGFQFGLDEKTARLIAGIAYPNKIGPKARVRKALSGKLKQLTSFEKQVQAHINGNAVRPDLVDSQNVSLLISNGIACGMTLPVYTGTFVSIANRQFGFTSKDRADLESAGVLVDDFQHRKNGVILTDGSRRIFDLTLKSR